MTAPATAGGTPRCWLVFLALGLGACGCGAGATGTVGQATAVSPSSTVAPPSAVALRAVRTAASRTLGLTATVSLDFAGGLSAKAISGGGSFSFASASGRAQIRQPAGVETVVFQPTIVFDHPPPQDLVGLPHGITWIAAEPAERIPNPTSFDQFALQIEGKNPDFLLTQVAWGAVAAAPLGTTDIGSGSASGYLVTVDLATAASSASGPGSRAFASALRDEEHALGGSGATPPQLTISAWIDPEGRVVRLEASPPGSGIGTTIMTMTAFGARVDAARPPKGETVDLASLAPGGDYDRD
ncbi:MAG: hypothetical protein WB565_04585 [Acidimicrobiales bacterium]